MQKPEIRKVDDGVIFRAKVVPASSRTEVCGLLGDKIKFKIAAAAEKGKANKALVKFLGSLTGLRKKDIDIVSGLTSEVKEIRIRRISTETLLKKLHLHEE